MPTVVYLLLGLAFIGGLFWALMQITARQRQLNAELTRLERLAAEVSLNAEAILERVDDRADRLNQLLDRAEARIGEAVKQAEASPPPVQQPAPVQQTAAVQQTDAAAPPPKKRSRRRKPEPAPEAPAAPAVAEPVPEATPVQKYHDLRSTVWAMADAGRNVAEIAQTLGVPRGEVQLLLNLRAKKVTA